MVQTNCEHSSLLSTSPMGNYGSSNMSPAPRRSLRMGAIAVSGMLLLAVVLAVAYTNAPTSSTTTESLLDMKGVASGVDALRSKENTIKAKAYLTAVQNTVEQQMVKNDPKKLIESLRVPSVSGKSDGELDSEAEKYFKLLEKGHKKKTQLKPKTPKQQLAVAKKQGNIKSQIETESSAQLDAAAKKDLAKLKAEHKTKTKLTTKKASPIKAVAHLANSQLDAAAERTSTSSRTSKRRLRS
eukprot:JP446549.1.p1 GENE.JP446549.1~~JP446549.1.p1  ORF type:complete len:241 (+),score=87.96 JP446549.1:32-754(+)